MGIAYAVFQKQLLSFNPVTSLAASAALDAIGGAMSALSSNVGSYMNGSTSGTYSGGGSGAGNYSDSFIERRIRGVNRNVGQQPQEVEFKIKGGTLVGVLQTNSRFRQRF